MKKFVRSFFRKNQWSSLVGLLLLGACGSDDEKSSQQINLSKLKWSSKDAVLRPNQVLEVEGEATSDNVDFKLSYSIKQRGHESDVSLGRVGLAIMDEPLAAGRREYNLHSDAKLRVLGTQAVCNGLYDLTVVALGGSARSVVKLPFEVRDGADCSQAFLTEDGDEYIQGGEGVVYNVLGENRGAYDLVGGRALSTRDADRDKDLADLTNEGSVDGSGFRMTLGSKNGALFVMAPSLDYAHLTKEKVQLAYNSGVVQTETPVLKAGDVVLVFLVGRGNSEIYALKINRVNKTESPSARGTNGGAIGFSYKKPKIKSVS